jgi:hypothetical protein
LTDIPPSGPAGPAGCGAAWIAFILTAVLIGAFIIGIWWMLRSAGQM